MSSIYFTYVWKNSFINTILEVIRMACRSNSEQSVSFESLSHDLYYANMLIDEIMAENLGEVKRLLEVKKINPNILVPELGATPMHFLAGHENEDFGVVVVLIAMMGNRGDPNVRSDEGLTPVHISAMWGRCRTLEVLLANGGNPYLVDYNMFLDAEDYALKECQWNAYGILSTFAVFEEHGDRFSKEKIPHLSINPIHTSSPRARRNFEAKTVSDVDYSSRSQTFVNEDCDWLTKTMEVIPLNESAISTIKEQRRKTKIYEYPNEESYRNVYSTVRPKLPRRNKPRHEKKEEESETYLCGFAESSYRAKRSTHKTRSREGPESLTSESVDATVQSNRMLCKMSRIFLFMLKKRHKYESLK